MKPRLYIKQNRSTGTVHTSAKAHLTSDGSGFIYVC